MISSGIASKPTSITNTSESDWGSSFYNAASSIASSLGLLSQVETSSEHGRKLMKNVKQMVEENSLDAASIAITVLRLARKDDIGNAIDRKMAASQLSECLAILQAFISTSSRTAHFLFFLESLIILSESAQRLWQNVDIRKAYLTYMNDVYVLLDNAFRGLDDSSTSTHNLGSHETKSSVAAPASAPTTSSDTSSDRGINGIQLPLYKGSADVYTIVGLCNAYVTWDDLYDDMRFFLQERFRRVGQPESAFGVMASKYYRRSMWQFYLVFTIIDMHRHKTQVRSQTARTQQYFAQRFTYATTKLFSLIDNGSSKKQITMQSCIQIGISWLDCCRDLLSLKDSFLPITIIDTVGTYISNNALILQADQSNVCVLSIVTSFGYGVMAGMHRELQTELGLVDDGALVEGPLEVDRHTLLHIREVDLCLAQWTVSVIAKSPSSISLKVCVSAWCDAMRSWAEHISLMGKSYTSDFSDRPGQGNLVDRAERFWSFIFDRFLALANRGQASRILACVVCLAPTSETFKAMALEEVVELITTASIKLSFDMLVVCQITPRSLPLKALNDLVANRIHTLSSLTDTRDVLVKHEPILNFLDSAAMDVLADLRSTNREKTECARLILAVISVFISATAAILNRLSSQITNYSSSKSKQYLVTTTQDYLLLYLCIPLKLPGFARLINGLVSSDNSNWNDVMSRTLQPNVSRFVSAIFGDLYMDDSRIARLREEELLWMVTGQAEVDAGNASTPTNRLYAVMSDCLVTLSLNDAINSRHHSSRGFHARDETEDLSYVIAKTSKYFPSLRTSKEPRIPLLYVMLAGNLLMDLKDYLADNIFNWPSNIGTLFGICHHITDSSFVGHWNVGPTEESIRLTSVYKESIAAECQLETLLVTIKNVTFEVIIGLNDEVDSHSLSISQLRSFTARSEETVIGWEQCRLEVTYDSSISKIGEKIALLEQLCGQLRQLFGVISWLKSIDVMSRQVTLSLSVKDLDTTSCIAIIGEFQRAVSLLGSSVTGPDYRMSDTLQSLCYFICGGSNLYSAHFRKFKEEYFHEFFDDNGDFQFGSFIDAANESSFGAMRHLLDSDDILLSDFAEGGMQGFMDGLCGRSKEDVLKELKIITDFVEPNAAGVDNVGDIDHIQMKIKRVKSAVRLLRIQNVLGAALDACLNPKIGLLRHIQVLPGGAKSSVQMLLDIRSDLETRGKFTLSDVPDILAHVDGILQGIEPGHLELLAELNNAHQLLVFLQAERDFEGQLVLHTQEMQGTDIGGKVLTDLAIAHKFLKSLDLTDSSRKTGPGWDFAKMVSVLRSNVPTEADAEEVMAAISSASEHMAEISLWFSGGSAILNLQKLLSNVKKYMADGMFVTVFSDEIETSLLQLRVQRSDGRMETIKAEVLVELIRGIVLSRGEAAAEEDRIALDSFLMAYDQAQKTHEIVTQARRNCVPAFHGTAMYEHASMSDLSSLRGVETEISAWYDVYNAKLASSPRLHFLSRKQLLMCLHNLKVKKEILGLAGFVRLCFPDCVGKVPDIMNMLISKLQTAGSRDFVGSNADVFEECLTVFCDTLASCTRMFIDSGLVEEPDSDDSLFLPPKTSGAGVTQAKPVVIKAEHNKSHALYGELNSRNEGPPLPSQLLWCNGATTVNEIRDFIARASVWKSVFFAFLNVNLLRAAPRDALLEACLDATSTGLALHEHIFLFFCGERGLDAFTVLQNESVDIGEEGSTGYLRGMDTGFGMNLLFPDITIVTGEACVGKSTYIKNKLNGLNADDQPVACTVLTVHENVLFGPLVEWYRNEKLATQVGFHINVCAHSLYRSVDRIEAEDEVAALNAHLLTTAEFLHSLVHCGVLADDKTGDVAVLNPNTKHHLYVELPSVLTYGADSKLSTGTNVCSKHSYSSLLAPVVNARTGDIEVDSSKFPFIISREARLVALYVKCYRQGRLNAIADNFPTLDSIDTSALSDTEALTTLNGVWGTDYFVKEPNNRTKDTFIRLMLERVIFMAGYVSFYKYESQHSGQAKAISSARTLAHDCMTIFLREVTAICSELSGDWSKANCAYTVRYTTSIESSTSRVGMTCLVGESYLPDFPSGMDDTKLRIDNACDNPGLWGTLRSEVALAYGMDDTNRVLTLLQSQNYILTPDFAVKLLVLRDMHSCGTPAILQGSTGTGKTEQIQILSLLLNNRSDLMPNMVERTYDLLLKLVNEGMLSPSKQGHEMFFQDGAFITNVKVAFDTLFSFLEEADDEFIEAAGCLVVSHFREIFSRFDLLRKSDLVSGVINALNRIENVTTAAANAAAGVLAGVGPGSRLSTRITSSSMTPVTPHFEDTAVDDLAEILTGINRLSARPAESNHIDGRLFRSNVELLAFMREATSSKLESIFFVIRMHEGIGPEHWREKVAEIETAARLKEGINIVAFVDELNTSTIMGMIKEVMMDGTLDGRALPKNIFWIGATNPVTTYDASNLTVPTLDVTLSNVGVVDEEEDANEYIVRSLLPSLECTVLDVGTLASEQEKNFLAAYLFDSNLGFSASVGQGLNLLPPSWFAAMRDLILRSQEFVRDCGMRRTKVSIRDLMRTLQLYKFFLDPQTMDFFVPATPNPGEDFLCRTPMAHCWRALCLSISTVYQMRLSSGSAGYLDQGPRPSGSDLRSDFLASLWGVIYAYDDMAMLSEKLPFKEIVDESLQHVYKNTAIPIGIAPTRALQENIFVCVTCFTACLPIIITGPPGCGKTLSMQIVLDNMKGASSPNVVYQNLKNANRFTYQCSEGSDAGEIKAVYETALQRHKRFTRARIYSERCVVCLDEASLPRKRRAALKVTHYYLDRARDSDRPAVSTIMLTNRTLDAAKTNRAVQLLQSTPSSDDLFALVKGCLMPDGGVVPPYQYDLMRGLCNAFQNMKHLYDIDGRTDIFQLRDFIFFLRYLRRGVDTAAKQNASDQAAPDGASRIALSTNTFVLTAEDLVAALRRNFNGVAPEQFAAIVDHFLRHTRLPRRDQSVSHRELYEPKVIESLREAIADSTGDDEDPNHSAFRHIMIIDKTDTECSISLLFEMKLLNPETTDICHLADFDDDVHERQKIELAAKIKHAVEQGRTVILSNAQSVYSAFYDLFNKHYSSVRVSSSKGGDEPTASESPATRRYYANIGIGSLSRPCIVHPKARVIVHVTKSEFAKIQLPFLNRFEKYSISLKDVVNENLSAISRRNLLAPNKVKLKSELFSYVMAGVRHFVEYLGEISFYGVLTDETISALILRSLNDSIAVGSDVPIFQLPRHISSGSVATAWSALKSYETESSLYNVSHSMVSDDNESEPIDPPSLVSSRSIEQDVHIIGPFTADDVVPTGGTAYSSDPFCNIDKYVRAVNFQLLQLIRPEVLFSCRHDLPKAYLEEALERQEHFSAVNLIRGLCSSHWKHLPDIPRTNAPNVCTKWSVFTHTSSELLQLHSSEAYQRLLLPSTLLNDIDTIPGNSLTKVMRVVSISHFHRSMQVENCIHESIAKDEFKQGYRRVLIILADRSVVTSAQVSLVMRVASQASDRLEYALRPLVVLIQHFSAEMTNLRAVYDALPFAGWDMYYVDSFGYSEDIFKNGSNSSETQGRASSNIVFEESKGGEPICSDDDSLSSKLAVAGMPYGMSDVRSWMLVAYGLNDSPSRADAINEFSHSAMLEVKILGSILSTGRRLMDPQLKRLGIIRALPLYRFTRNGGGEWLQTFFASHNYILHELLSHVTAAWGQVLHSAVDYAVSSLREGRTSLGMMDHTRAALSGFLKGCVRYAVVQLAGEYGFESLAGLPSDSQLLESNCPHRESVAFVTHVLRGMQAPSRESLERFANSSSVSVPLDCNFVCRLPLYHFFSQAISTLRNDIILRAPVAVEGSDSRETLLKKMESEVQLNRHLASAIEIICNNSSLFADFLRDYIQETLPQAQISEAEMQVIVKVLMLQDSPSPLAFYAEPKEDHFLVEILSTISPFTPLSELPNSKWNLTSLMTFLDTEEVDVNSGQSDAERGGLSAIKTFIIQQIWDALIEVSSITSNSDGTEAFTKWLLAARDLMVLQITGLTGLPLKRFAVIGFVHSFIVHHPNASSVMNSLRTVAAAELSKYREKDSFSVLVTCMAILGGTLGGVRMTDADRADVYRAVSSPIFDSIFRVHSAYTDEDLHVFLSALAGDQSTAAKSAIRLAISHNHSATVTAMLRNLLSTEAIRFAHVADEVLRGTDIVEYSGLALTSAIRVGVDALPDRFPQDCLPGYTPLPAKARQVIRCQNFVNILHSALTSNVLRMVQELSFPGQLSALFALLTTSRNGGTTGFALVKTTSVATCIVTHVASSLSQDRELIHSISHFKEDMTDLFTAHPILILLFVSSFNSDAAMMAFLGVASNVEAIGLPSAWHLPQQVSAELLFRCPPCMLITTDPLYADYQEIRRILINPGVSSDEILGWANQKCTTASAILRCRHLLVLALYHELFLPLCENESRRYASNLVLDCFNKSSFRRKLSLTDEERDMLVKVAQGPHTEHCNFDDGLKYFFSISVCKDPVNATFRAAAVNALSLLLGSKKSACYYYQVCFATETMEQSMGLGSGYGRIAKDCGYQTTYDAQSGMLTFHDFAENPAGPKFGEIPTLRAMNNYWVWASYAWGAWIRMGKSQDLFNAYSWTTEYPNDYAPGRTDVTLHQRIVSTIIARAHSFLAMLSTDRRLAQAGVDSELYVTLCAYYTTQQFQECSSQFGYFDKTNHEDALTRQRDCMQYLSGIWNTCQQNAVTIRDQYLEANLVKRQMIMGFKMAYAGVAVFINEIPDKSAVDTVIKIPLEAHTDPKAELYRKISVTILNDLDRLSVNLHLPLIVHFYKWIHKQLAYKVCDSERHMYVRDAICRIEDAEQRAYGMSLFQRFLRSWNKMIDSIGELAEVCPTAAGHGESQLPFFDDDLILSRILSTGEIDDEDNIVRLLKNQILVQNKLIGNDDIKEVLDPDSAASLNMLSILSKPHGKDFHVMNVTPTLKPQSCRSIIGAENTLDIYQQMVCVATRPCAELDSLSFDLRAAAVFLLRTLVSGKPVMTMDPRPSYFKFIRDTRPTCSEATNGSPREESTAYDPIQRVLQLAEELRRILHFPRPVEEEPISVEVATVARQIRDEASAFRYLAVISTLAEEMLAVCINLCEAAEQHNDGASPLLSASVQYALGGSHVNAVGAVRGISNMTVRSFIVYAEVVCRIQSKREYLYISLQANHTMAPLDSHIEASLNMVQKQLLVSGSHIALNHILKLVREIIEVMTVSSARAVILESSQSTLLCEISSLSEVFVSIGPRAVAAIERESEHSGKGLPYTGYTHTSDPSTNQILQAWSDFLNILHSIPVSMTISFLRALTTFCSKAASALTATPSKSTVREIYTEMVPDDMKLFQTLGEEDVHRSNKSPPSRSGKKPPLLSAEMTSHSSGNWDAAAPPIPPAYFDESKMPEPSYPYSSHRSTTTALSLSDMWGASLADISFLASNEALVMQRETGSGWVMYSDTIPSQLENLSSAIISVANLAEVINSDADTLAEVLEAHDIRTFTFFGMKHILKSHAANVSSIFGGDDTDSHMEGGNNNESFNSSLGFDELPASAPELTYQTSDEMRDLILTGFASSENPTDRISLSDLAIRWGMSVSDLNLLVDRGWVQATAPSRPSDPWTVPTASLSDFQASIDNALTNVQFIAEMLEKSITEVKRIVASIGVKIIRRGSGDFVFSSDVDRCVQACWDNN